MRASELNYSKKRWLCDSHQEVFVGQVNEVNISTLKTEDT